MTPPANPQPNAKVAPKATEQRLDEIRKAAAEAGPSHIPPSEQSYYGLPALKPPTWTWEVPIYFFLGGIAGVSSCIAFVAQLFRADPALIRVSLWAALIGAAICPALLISDLGRPSRFLYMLRVFKIRSAMSLGVWILVAFSNCALLALVGFELVFRGHANFLTDSMLWLGLASAALTGLLLASYTGVLVGATAIPVWLENRKFLPAHFLASGLGGASGLLELAGFLVPVTQLFGVIASGAETLMEIFLILRRRPVDAPLHQGPSGKAFLVAGLLEGPASLFLRLLWHSAPVGRYAAVISFLAGSLLSRYAWVWAGRASSRDPRALFELQRHSQPTR